MKIKKIEKICCYYLNVFDDNDIFYEYKKNVTTGVWFIKLFDKWELFDDESVIKILNREIVKDMIK